LITANAPQDRLGKAEVIESAAHAFLGSSDVDIVAVSDISERVPDNEVAKAIEVKVGIVIDGLTHDATFEYEPPRRIPPFGYLGR